MNITTQQKSFKDTLLHSSPDAYKPDIRRYFKWLGSKSFTMKSITNYINHLKLSGKSAATINKFQSGMKTVIRKQFLSNPELSMQQKFKMEEELQKLKQVKRNSIAVDTKKVLTKEEVDKMITYSTPKLGILIQFLFETGLRITEAVSIRNDEIKKYDKLNYTFKVIGKGNKEREIYAPIKTIQHIRLLYCSKEMTYLFSTRNDTHIISTNASMDIKRAGKKILDKNISAHTLRHSFSTNMIHGKRKDIKAVSMYLGHSSTALTLDMYVHSSLTTDDLFGA